MNEWINEWMTGERKWKPYESVKRKNTWKQKKGGIKGGNEYETNERNNKWRINERNKEWTQKWIKEQIKECMKGSKRNEWKELKKDHSERKKKKRIKWRKKKWTKNEWMK